MRLIESVKDLFQTKVVSWYLIALFVGIAVVADVFVNRLVRQKAITEQEVSVTLELSAIRARLEQHLNNNLFLVYGMASHFSIHPNISNQEFETLARLLMSQSHTIKNIGAAPNFVIRYIYPKKTNEAAIGLDYRTVPEQWPQALTAKETGKMTVAGPLNLVQGGVGLIVRVPVFLEKDQQFWGLVSAVMDFDKVAEQTGLGSDNVSVEVAIRGKDSKGMTGDIFWGDPDLFKPGTKTISMSVSLPTGYWQMSAVPKKGWAHHSSYSWLIHCLIGVIAFIGLFSSIQQRRSRIALIESANRLRAMSEASHDALIMIDDRGNITFWNPAAEVMFGYTLEEILGKQLHPLLAQSHERENASAGLSHFAITGEGVVLNRVVELNALRKNGDIFPAELAVAPFKFSGRWYAVGGVRDITARKESEKRLTLLATTDALTGLLNRRRFLELAEMEFRRAVRYKNIFCLMTFDLDHFKSINDTYGHDVGDKVLRKIAETARLELRETDVIGRIGGEEFAVIMPEIDMDTAKGVGERIRTRIMNTHVQIQSKEIGCTVSVGLAMMDDTVSRFEQLMKKADEAMYTAKRDGRNRVVI